MITVSEYISKVIQYKSSGELTNHVVEMESNGWKPVSISYGKLRVRYRKDVGDECDGIINGDIIDISKSL